MNIAEIKELFELAGVLGIGAIIGGGIVFLMIKSFLPSYLSTKAKNLATKEDIGAITHEVEQVKTNYAEVLEEIKSNHQLRLASIEREKLLKKEVYLEAFEALSRYQNSLSLMSNLDVSHQVVSDSFSSSAAQVSKIKLVGSESTVKYLTEFMGEVAAAYMSLMLARGGLMSQKNHINFLETIRQKHNNEIDRCLTIMKNMNLEGVIDQEAWARVNRSFEDECKSRDRIASEINANWAVHNEELFSFIEDCMSEFFRVNGLTPKLLLSVRTELELQIDEHEYREIHTANTAKAMEVFETFMNKAREAAKRVA